MSQEPETLTHYPAVILGAGFTGLGAGYGTNIPVFEASSHPGGICRSYYVDRDNGNVSHHKADNSYRFENGGGHWIFDQQQDVIRIFNNCTPLNEYHKKSDIFLKAISKRIPFPIQQHIESLGNELQSRILEELNSKENSKDLADSTMAEWLHHHFGKTLCSLFFNPFHQLYTAGLYNEILPQDPYKTPVISRKGAASYNDIFRYPIGGLDALADKLSENCDIRYGYKAAAIDAETRTVSFENGYRIRYDRLISTLPLRVMAGLVGKELSNADPYTSVLVVNVGGVRGESLTDAHWTYFPESGSGFHRIGTYSNVDRSFLPAAASDDLVSFYVEFSFGEGRRPAEAEIRTIEEKTVQELTEMRCLKKAEVVHSNWIEHAYTWKKPGSDWTSDMLSVLAESGIEQVGRFALWKFQGIGKSFYDGMTAVRA